MPNDKLQSLPPSAIKKLFDDICQAAREKAKSKLNKIKLENGTLDVMSRVNGHDETPASFLAQQGEFQALQVLLKYPVDTYWIMSQCIDTRHDSGVKFLLEKNVISINLPASLYAEKGNDEKTEILRLCGASANWIVWGYAANNNHKSVGKLLAGGASRYWACDGYATGRHHESVNKLFSKAENDSNDYLHLQRRAVRGAAEAGDKKRVKELLQGEMEGDNSLGQWAIDGYATAGEMEVVTELLAKEGDPVLSDRLHKRAIRKYARGGHHDDFLPAQIEVNKCHQAMQGFAEGGYSINAEDMFNKACALDPAKTANLLSDLLQASAIGGHYAQTAVFFEQYSHKKNKHDLAYVIAHAYAEEGHIVELKRWVTEQKLTIDQIKDEYRRLIDPMAGDDKITVAPVSPEFLLHWHFSAEPPVDRALSLLKATIKTDSKGVGFFNFVNSRQKIKKICKQANKNGQGFSMEQLLAEINEVLPQLSESSKLAQCIRFINAQAAMAQPEKAAVPWHAKVDYASDEQKSALSDSEPSADETGGDYVDIPQPPRTAQALGLSGSSESSAAGCSPAAQSQKSNQKADPSESDSEQGDEYYYSIPMPSIGN